jgi:N utilization substance protein A
LTTCLVVAKIQLLLVRVRGIGAENRPFFQKKMALLRKLPKTEFAAAVAQIAGERKIDPEAVIESVKLALIAAYKKDAKERGEEVSDDENYRVRLDPETGETHIILVEDDKEKDVTPPGFGRIAAQTAKQVIIQKIREAEKEAIFRQFKTRIGTLVSGVILRIDRGKVIVGIGKTEAIMPRREQTKGEEYEPNRKMSFYVKEIAEEDGRKEIILSRNDPRLVIELFRREVPEVSLGSVEIKAIARQPGQRTKVAVASSQPGVDPVGSCVGQKGVRVQKVTDELGEEKIDIVPYSENLKQFVVAALSPAEGGRVAEVDEKLKEVTVAVPDDQLALAIGVRGENVHSASELVGWRIKVVGESSLKEKPSKTKKKTKKKKKSVSKKESKKKESKSKKNSVKNNKNGK